LEKYFSFEYFLTLIFDGIKKNNLIRYNMYLYKSVKYNNKLKQSGGLSCPFSSGQEILIPSNNPGIPPDVGTIHELQYNINGNIVQSYFPSLIVNEPDPRPDLGNQCINLIVYPNRQIPITPDIRPIESLTKQEFIAAGYNTFAIEMLNKYFARYFTLSELIDLHRLRNPHINEALANYPFDFYNDPIPNTMRLQEFREIFRLAIGINLSNHTLITDNEFNENILQRPIQPIQPIGRGKRSRPIPFELDPIKLKINISSCTRLTNNAFVILRNNIDTLNMSNCHQITDEAFVNLVGIQTLNMSNCRQITDAAFVHLTGIQTLDMSNCRQITDAAFVHLTGIQTLDMSNCNQITDNAFVHLGGIQSLDMRFCHDITNAAFAYLEGIQLLNMTNCGQITDDAFVHLTGIHTLDMSGCNQEDITDNAFVYLNGIHTLIMTDCDQVEITDYAFINLRGIHTLEMANCDQEGITGNGFCVLNSLKILDINSCNQRTISKARQTFGVTPDNQNVLGFNPCR